MKSNARRYSKSLLAMAAMWHDISHVTYNHMLLDGEYDKSLASYKDKNVRARAWVKVEEAIGLEEGTF